MKGKVGSATPMGSAPNAPHTNPKTTTYDTAGQIPEMIMDKIPPGITIENVNHNPGGAVEGGKPGKRLDKRLRGGGGEDDARDP